MQHVCAEYAAIGVQLVDDDKAQVRKEIGPCIVKSENTRMQHVGRGKEHVRRVGANFLALIVRCVAVVDANRQFGVEPLHQSLYFIELVLLERFERKNVERARLFVFE